MSETNLNTGVDEVLDAAEQETEVVIDESTGLPTPPMPEDEQPETVKFEDLFNEGSDKTVEDTSADGSQEQPDEEQTPEQDKPADYYRSQAEVDAAFAERIRREREKWESDQAAKLQGRTVEQLIENDIETEARKFMEENKDMNMTLDFAKRIVRGDRQQVKPTAQPEQDTTQKPDNETQKLEAWKKAIADEEPMLAIMLGKQADPARPGAAIAEYASENPIFRKVLSMGYRPSEAYEIAKAFETDVSAKVTEAKTTAKREVIDSVKKSSQKAMPVTTGTKSGPKRSATDIINSMSLDDFQRLNRLAEQGKTVTFD